MPKPPIKSKPSRLSYLIILILLIGFIIWQKKSDKGSADSKSQIEQPVSTPQTSTSNPDVLELTNEDIVIAYLKQHHELPNYYITKSEAKKLGWQPSEGNLCKRIPGKAIGGDYFGNYEGKLPKKKGRKYHEADINYACGNRNAQRLIYSNDGLIFITKDHYKNFKKR